jgi:ABC-type branched-subunit amino acid transport system ATPase component
MAVREQPQGNLDVPAHAAVEARDLTRVYGEGDTAVEALRGVDIEVNQGEIVTLIGANGDGKTTTLMTSSPASTSRLRGR